MTYTLDPQKKPHAGGTVRCMLAWTYLVSTTLLWPGTALAGAVEVTVSEPSGHGVDDVVVTLTSAALAAHALSREPATAVMDQQHIAFVPQVLVVSAGTEVTFPNTDTVSHQVYSFSAAKKFQLPLYKGAPHAPVVFDKEGLVVLGCNIHDEMVGYVYVTASPYFGKTAGGGSVRLNDVKAGDYVVVLWSPRVADSAAVLRRDVRVEAAGVQTVRIELTRALRARPEPRAPRPDWRY